MTPRYFTNNVPNGHEYHQFIGNVENGKIVRSQLGEEISLEDCPENVQDAIEQRIKESA